MRFRCFRLTYRDVVHKNKLPTGNKQGCNGPMRDTDQNNVGGGESCGEEDPIYPGKTFLVILMTFYFVFGKVREIPTGYRKVISEFDFGEMEYFSGSSGEAAAGNPAARPPEAVPTGSSAVFRESGSIVGENRVLLLLLLLGLLLLARTKVRPGPRTRALMCNLFRWKHMSYLCKFLIRK